MVLKKSILLVLLIILLDSCSASDIGGPTCIGPTITTSNESQTNSYSVSNLSPSTTTWTSANINVQSGEVLTVNAYGQINTCMTDSIFSVSSTNVSTGIDIAEGQVFSVTIPASQTTYAGTPSTSNTGTGISIYVDGDLINDPTISFPLLSSVLTKYSNFTTSTFTTTETSLTNSYTLSSSLNIYAYFSSGDTKTGEISLSSTSPSYLEIQTISPSCIVTNGVVTSGTNGAIEYLVAPAVSGSNPSQPDPTLTGTIVNDSLSINITDSGTLWFKVLGDSTQNSYTGFYNLDLTLVTPNSQSTLSRFMTAVTEPVIKQISFATYTIYTTITDDISYQAMIRSMLLLYIVLYAIYFLFGMTEITQQDVVVRAAKVGVIVTLLTSSTSWYIFNDYFLKLFTTGANSILYKITGSDPYSSNGVFGFIDGVFNQFFNQTLWLKLSTFCFLLIGLLYLVIIIWSMFAYLLVVCEAYIAYLIALTGVAFLISIAPIFLCLTLFQITRDYMNGWIKYLASFAMQPILLFSFLYIVNQLVIVAFDNAMSFTTCWECIIPIYIDMTFLIKGLYTVSGSDYILPFKIPLFCINYYSLQSGSPMELFPNLIIYVIYVLTLQAILDLAPAITDGLLGTSAGSAIAGVAKGIRQDAQSAATGQDQKSQERRQEMSKSQDNKSKSRVQPKPPAGDGKDAGGKGGDGKNGGGKDAGGKGGDGKNGGGKK